MNTVATVKEKKKKKFKPGDLVYINENYFLDYTGIILGVNELCTVRPDLNLNIEECIAYDVLVKDHGYIFFETSLRKV